MVAGYKGDRPLKTGPFDYAQGSYVSAAQGSCDNGDSPLGTSRRIGERSRTVRLRQRGQTPRISRRIGERSRTVRMKQQPGSVYFDRLSNRIVEPSACNNGDRPLHFNLQKSFCIL